MNCPYCGYEHSYDPEAWTEDAGVRGYDGDFYKLPVELTRQSDDYHKYTERVDLFACPACNKTFIGNEK